MGMSHAGRAQRHERRRRPGPRRDADHDRGALAGAAPGGTREEALRSARAHGRGRDDRRLLREHDCVTPVACRYFLGHTRAGPDRASFEAAIGRVRRGYSLAAARTSCRIRPGSLLRPASCSSSASGGRHAPAEHVLPGDRRVDGARLRALRAGHFARGCDAEDERDGRRLLHEGASEGDVELVLTNVGLTRATRAAP